jgi:alkylation response protein AidB-like acyl-CoA dehydrogenase
MDFGDSAEHAAFRSRVRAWIDARRPFPATGSETSEAQLDEWHAALRAEGLVGLSLPTDVGGQGLDIMYENILLEELGAAGAPPIWRRGYLARTLDRFGTAEQRIRFVPPALAGTEKWCQGFSEPEAGSDLASVRTRAVQDGAGYRISGQKVWTSGGHRADWCLLLARTDPDARKHAGLTCFLVDMTSTGVLARPFRQLTGENYFSELFFDDVLVPAGNILGEAGGGWRVTAAILSLERGPADIGFLSDFQSAVVATARALASRPGLQTPDAMLAFGRAAASVELLRLRAAESLYNRGDGDWDPAEASVDKLLMARADQELANGLAEAFGPAWLLESGGDVTSRYLWSRAATIRGGTAEIQRTIVATRLLGLPRG